MATLTAGSDLMDLHFCDLGSVLVEIGGTQRPPGGERPTAALALLLMNANRRVPAESLMEAMWGDMDRSPGTLDSHLYRLRQVVEPDRPRGASPSVVISDAGGYRLVVAADQVDSLRFAQLAEQAADLLRSGQPARALARTQEALGLWRGRPFASVADELWAVSTVARLEELYAQLLERQIDALLAVGDPERALVELENAQAAHPLRERLWSLRMLASYRCGRTDEALETFQRARRTFLDEVGVEPGPELRELQQRILAEDTTLAGPSREPATGPPASQEAPEQAVEPRLPYRRTPIIGRSDELARLCSLVLGNRLVTLTGSAGSGKTRLAIEAAHSISGDFVDGVWFVDLTVAGDGDQVLDTIISTVGIAPAAAGSPTDALRAFTRDRRMLLVLDNCEHVLDAVPTTAEALSVAGSELAILATSREPLDVDGEVVSPLAPLAVPNIVDDDPTALGSDHDLAGTPAVELFMTRLATAVPDAGPDPESLQLAAQICVALDGVPLAIELAAARARSFSLVEILQQVTSNPSTLSRIGRGGAAHHSTLRAAIQWSYQPLPDDLKVVHRRISVVPGEFTAAAAAAISGLDRATVDDALAGLVHRSLLVPRGRKRPGGPSLFAQLATIRSHGAHALDEAEESDATQERRNTWIVDTFRSCPRLGHADEVALFDALDDDLACLRASFQHMLVDRPSRDGVFAASRMGMYWYYRGMMLEGRRWNQLATVAIDSDPFDRAMSQMGLAGSWALNNRLDIAKPLLREAIAAVDGLPQGKSLTFGDRVATQVASIWLAGDHDFLPVLSESMRDIAARNGNDAQLAVIAEIFTSGIRVAPDAQPQDLARMAAAFDHAVAIGNHFAAWLGSALATQIALFLDDPASGLVWSNRSIEQHVRHHVGEGAVSLEFRGNLLTMAGDAAGAVRLYAAAKVHNQRAGIAWPSADGTTQLLATATGMLDPADFDRAWNSGVTLTLAEVLNETTAP